MGYLEAAGWSWPEMAKSYGWKFPSIQAIECKIEDGCGFPCGFEALVLTDLGLLEHGYLVSGISVSATSFVSWGRAWHCNGRVHGPVRLSAKYLRSTLSSPHCHHGCRVFAEVGSSADESYYYNPEG